MNMKLVKKLLVATLATSLVVMPITAFATTDSSGDNTTSTVTTSSSSSESSDTYVAPEGVKPTSEATIGGKVVKSTVSGSYKMGKTIKAAVFTQSIDGLKAAAGLGKNEKPFARVYESDAKKSPKALDAANGAATALGVTLLTDKGVYIDLGKIRMNSDTGHLRQNFLAMTGLLLQHLGLITLMDIAYFCCRFYLYLMVLLQRIGQPLY